MINKLVLVIALIVVFFTFGSALLASNCGQDKNAGSMNYDIPKDSKLKVIPDLENLDHDSLDIEVKNVGKFYSDIKIGELYNKCSQMLYFNIYDEKVIVSNGKYIYQFKYDVYLSSFSENQAENVTPVNYLLFKRIKGVSMYLEFIPKNGYWEIAGEGKYFSL